MLGFDGNLVTVRDMFRATFEKMGQSEPYLSFALFAS